MADQTWWPSWRQMLGSWAPLVVALGIGLTSVGGYVVAWWLGRKAERDERPDG
jgi:hypothetical protein